jgi:hypothetical protein
MSEPIPSSRFCLAHFALAHVCKILRADFLPFLVARTEFTILFEQVHVFIGCWILPPNIEVENAIGRVVLKSYQQGPQAVDVKPLLLLSEAAKGTSIVFKHVIIERHDRKDARDYTLQELLETLLGVNCSSFTSYAREAGCSIIVDLVWFQERDRTGVWVIELKATLPERYWKPWMAQWGLEQSLEKILDHMVTNIEDRGVGVGSPFTAYWNPMPKAKFYKQEHWVERLT